MLRGQKWCFRQKWQFSKKRYLSKKVGFSAKRVFFQKTGFSPKSGFFTKKWVLSRNMIFQILWSGTWLGAWDANPCSQIRALHGNGIVCLV